MSPEQVAAVTGEVELVRSLVCPLPPLAPDEEDCRARPVLPAEHRVRAELHEAEATGIALAGEWLIAVRIAGRARVVEFAPVAVGAGAHERLGVELERKRRREGVVQPGRKAQR